MYRIIHSPHTLFNNSLSSCWNLLCVLLLSVMSICDVIVDMCPGYIHSNRKANDVVKPPVKTLTYIPVNMDPVATVVYIYCKNRRLLALPHQNSPKNLTNIYQTQTPQPSTTHITIRNLIIFHIDYGV